MEHIGDEAALAFWIALDDVTLDGGVLDSPSRCRSNCCRTCPRLSIISISSWRTRPAFASHPFPSLAADALFSAHSSCIGAA